MSARLMSQKYPAAAGKFEPAMTFEEIGQVLGIRRQAAYFLFVSGLKKLRANRSAMKAIGELAEMRAAVRERSAAYGCVIARRS